MISSIISDKKLIDAFKSKQIVLAKTILSSGCSKNLVDPITQTPLIHLSISTRQPVFLKLFLQAGWDPNILSKHSLYPIQESILKHDIQSLELLLNYKANTSITNDAGDSLFHLIAFSSLKNPQTSNAMVKLLLDHHVNIFTKNNRGENPLHHACRYSPSSIVHIYASQQKITPQNQTFNLINQTDLDGFTPLHALCNGIILESNLKTFLNFQPNLNAQDREGNTPLHLIAKKIKITSQDLVSVNLLLNSGSDPSIVNYQNFTPYDLALFNFKLGREIPDSLLKTLNKK